MRAVAFDDYGGPAVLHAADLPVPLPGPGAVRIRVAAAAVNPADVKWRAGMFRDVVPLPLPAILGYDVAGTVDALGPDVTGWGHGDRVMAMLDPIAKGGYATFAVVAAAAIARVPDQLDLTIAAAIPTAGLTGFQLIERHVLPRAGETALITGATGAVGRFAMHAARAAGARVVAAVRDAYRDEAARLGADAVIALGDDAFTDGFDHVADTVGGAAVARLCRGLRPGGRIRTVATTSIDPAGLTDVPQFVAVESDGAMLARIAARVADGTIAVPVDRVLPLDAAADAHRLVEAGGLGGKIVLRP